jgi:hypothetical protein
MELGLEGWKKSVEAVKADQTSLGGFALRHQDQIESLGRSFTVIGGAIVGAFGLMITQAANYGDKMDELKQRTGASVEILTGLDGTLKKNGSSVEDLANGIRTLSGKMVDANSGNVTAIALFDSLGIKVTDANGKLKSTTDVLFDIANRFHDAKDGAEKTTAAVDLLGKGGMALIPTLNLGASGLKAEADEAGRLGKVLTQEAAKAASDFNDQLEDLKSAAAGATMSLAEVLMPVVKDVIEDVKEVVIKFKDWTAEHPALTEALVKLTAGAGALMVVAGPMLLLLPQLAKGYELMKGGVESVGGAISNLGQPLSSSGNLLGKVALVGASAFIGWEIGRLVGEMTGLDGVLGGVFDKTFNFLGVAKGMNAEFGSGHAAAYALQQQAIGLATETTGKHANTFLQALDLLIPLYERTGTTGSTEIDRLVKGHIAAEKAGADHRKEIKDKLIPAFDGVTGSIKKISSEIIDTMLPTGSSLSRNMEEMLGATTDLSNFIKNQGIPTIKDNAAEVVVLKQKIELFHQALRDGIIDLQTHDRAVEVAEGKIKALSTTITYTALPACRDLSSVYGLAVDEMNSKDYKIAEKVKESVDKVPGFWDDVLEKCRYDWSDQFVAFFDNDQSLETSLNRIFKSLRESFKQTIADMLVDWVTNGLKGMVTATETAATTMGTAFKGIGSIITGIATALGTVITTLVTAISTALVTLATAIATAATTLAAAAPALMIVGAIALALYAGFKAIQALFGGGGATSSAENNIAFMKLALDAIRDTLIIDIRDDQLNHMIWWDEELGRILTVICQKLDNIANLITIKIDNLAAIMNTSGFWNLFVDIKNQIVAAIGSQTNNNIVTVIEGLKGRIGDVISAVDRIGGSGINRIVDGLDWIWRRVGDVVDAIGGIAGAQTGGIAWTPQLVSVAESGPEVIMPLGDYMRGEGPARGGLNAGGSSVSIHINQTINAQTLDRQIIDRAAEYLTTAIERQVNRRGRGFPYSR